jgi:GNAT superfamily N-acetyltransferase
MQISEEPISNLAEYERVSIAFTVNSRLRVKTEALGMGGFPLVEEPVSPPYTKDYDQEANNRPQGWLKRWDTSNWGVLAAYKGQARIGGAVLAYNTPEIHLLEGRPDLAVLWDIRVQPKQRGQGVGKALFNAAADWARQHGCTLLKVETQNINVPACRFYAQMGCELGAINLRAYPDLPEEIQLLWYYEL